VSEKRSIVGSLDRASNAVGHLESTDVPKPECLYLRLRLPRCCFSSCMGGYQRTVIDRTPADVREKFLSVLEWAENTKSWNDAMIDRACKDSDRRINEVMFFEAQIKVLIQAIRVTKDVDSIRQFRATTRETIERIRERKCQGEGAASIPPVASLADVPTLLEEFDRSRSMNQLALAVEP
jgi:hypothetical protein